MNQDKNTIFKKKVKVKFLKTKNMTPGIKKN